MQSFGGKKISIDCLVGKVGGNFCAIFSVTVFLLCWCLLPVILLTVNGNGACFPDEYHSSDFSCSNIMFCCCCLCANNNHSDLISSFSVTRIPDWSGGIWSQKYQCKTQGHSEQAEVESQLLPWHHTLVYNFGNSCLLIQCIEVTLVLHRTTKSAAARFVL